MESFLELRSWQIKKMGIGKVEDRITFFRVFVSVLYAREELITGLRDA